MRALLKPALFALLALIWGSTWMVIKVGYGGLGPFNVAALRFLVAGLVVAPIAFALRVRWPTGRAEYALVAAVGFAMFSANYGLIYWGEQWLDSGLTAVLFAVMPVLTAVLAHFYLPTEHLTPRKLAGTLLAFLGVAALFADSLRLDPALAIPMAAIIVSALSAGMGSVLLKRHGHDLHPAALNAPAMLVGALFLTIASLVAGDGFRLPSDAITWQAVGYLAVAGSVITFLGYFWLLRTWNATTVSFVAIFTPVVALALGYVFLDERPTPYTALGGVLILAGVALALTKGRRSGLAPRS